MTVLDHAICSSLQPSVCHASSTSVMYSIPLPKKTPPPPQPPTPPPINGTLGVFQTTPETKHRLEAYPPTPPPPPPTTPPDLIGEGDGAENIPRDTLDSMSLCDERHLPLFWGPGPCPCQAVQGWSMYVLSKRNGGGVCGGVCVCGGGGNDLPPTPLLHHAPV